MSDTPLDDMDPAETRLAERVHGWLDRAVVPIDAAAIARRAAAPRSRAGTMSRLGALSVRLVTGTMVLVLGAGALSLLAGQGSWTTPGAAPSPSGSPALPGFVAPVEFTGHFLAAACPGGPPDSNRWVSVQGAVCQLRIVEMSDPRLLGEGEVQVDREVRADGNALSMIAHRIQNDGGAWQEVPEVAIEHRGGPTVTRTITLRGEGGYAGLTVVAELSDAERGWGLHGYILHGDPPTANASEPPTAPASGQPME
jgi:hypothetical protein